MRSDGPDRQGGGDVDTLATIALVEKEPGRIR
jgi:hypothetical protein